jgi:hypothetical protein
MLPLHKALSLSRTMFDEDAVVLVASITWLGLRAEGGYHEVDTRKALWMLEDLDQRRQMDIRSFVSEARLSSFPLSRMDDQAVIALLRDAVRDGRVVAVEKGGAATKTSSATIELRRLVAQLEKQTRGKLSHQGRHYKLIVDVELASFPSRDSYEVASQSEARAVLDGIAKESPASAALLKQASKKLSKDWRPPLQPDGLVMLRRIPVQASAPKDYEPPISPSQMKRLMAGWIELVVVWDDTGQPVPGVPLTLQTSGNRQSLKTDGSGRVRLEDVEAYCEVMSNFKGATLDQCLVVSGVGSVPVKAASKRETAVASTPLFIAAIEAYKVKSGETIESISASVGMDWKQLAKFNWGTDSPKEVNERLRADVGCTKKTADGRNYVLDDADSPGIIYIPSEWSQSFQPRRTYYLRVRRPKGILITLENEEGLRLPEVGYQVEFDDGTERTGNLGRNGMALVPAPSTGTFLVSYPDEVDILAKSLAASLRKGFDDRKTDQIFRLFTHDRPVVARAVAAYNAYFNDYTGNGFTEDLYQELVEPEAIAVCEALMALHGLPTRSGVRVSDPFDGEPAPR